MIGARRRRNEQCVDTGGGKCDRAGHPSGPGADNRDLGGESGFHRDPAITELRIRIPVKKPTIANNLDAIFKLTCKLATWIPILLNQGQIRRAAPQLSQSTYLPHAAP